MSPAAPRRPCNKPGCGILGLTPYCEKHTKVKAEEAKIKDKYRGTASSRGYGYRWSKASKLYRENNPLCIMCQKKGILKLNNCVDHIEPVSGPDDPKFWDETNWQGLCTTCHGIKTASEDGGFGNTKVIR